MNIAFRILDNCASLRITDPKALERCIKDIASYDETLAGVKYWHYPDGSAIKREKGQYTVI